MSTERPREIRSVGILGGGTAGYLTALALQRRFPDLRVEVIASRDVPPIGVGESTLRHIVGFLHDDLDLEPGPFYREVEPTWKLGTRLWWGLPGDHCFNFPFDRTDHRSAHQDGWDLRTGSLQALLMEADRSFLVADGSTPAGARPLRSVSYAYQLDNRRFITYLKEQVRARGVPIVDAHVERVEVDPGGERVLALRADDGRSFTYDLYVDCSGFRSLLLGEALGVPWIDFGGSLFTDQAVTARMPHGGRIRPYTEVHTLDHGWAWLISMRDEDHLGYVFSGAHASPDEAAAELEARFGVTAEPRAISFPTGRRERPWKGNVVAVGNSFAFVEPLQATGIQMIVSAIRSLTEALAGGGAPDTARSGYNHTLVTQWDFVRWFIALHYRFNRRLDTPFWRDCRRDVDISGIEHLVAWFRDEGLLSLAAPEVRRGFASLWEAGLFGTNGIDLLLLAQGERPPPGSLPRDPDGVRRFQGKRALWGALAGRALEHVEALCLVEREPGVLR